MKKEAWVNIQNEFNSQVIENPHTYYFENKI